jgi:membrane associated rhomboid family serine protease
MGIYDRGYYRDDQTEGGYSAGAMPMVTKLVIINVVFYVLDIFTNNHWLMDTMAASPYSLTRPWLWWQLVSYGFAHSPIDQWHIISNMFGLWMFGREVEGVYGPREILRLYLVVVVLAGIAWAARVCFTVPDDQWRQYVMLGASGAVTAIILLFCFLFPKRTILLMFVIPAPAWVLGALIIITNVMGMRMPESGGASGKVAYDVHLVGAAFAFLYYRFGWNLGRLTPQRFSFPAWFKRRPQLKLHDPSDRPSQDEEADRVLEKVNQHGIDSLTSRERRVLEEYSRRMRQKYR